MSEGHEHRSESIFSKIAIPVLVAVLIALIAGGTAPWWWEKVFPAESATPTPRQSSEASHSSPQPSESAQPSDQPAASEEPTFLGSIHGEWAFETWQERSGPVTLNFEPLAGTLVIDAIGHAYWDMDLDDGSGAPQPTSGLVCLGVVDAASETLSRWTGGPLAVNGDDVMAVARDWTSNLNSLRGDALLAFCGSAFPESELFVYDTTTSNYELTVTTAGGGRRLLTMRNAAGTFTWKSD